MCVSPHARMPHCQQPASTLCSHASTAGSNSSCGFPSWFFLDTKSTCKPVQLLQQPALPCCPWAAVHNIPQVAAPMRLSILSVIAMAMHWW